MGRDEHEMLIEYSEMTTFNFNSKEYQEVKQDFIECKEAACGFEFFMQKIMNCFKANEA